MKTLRFFMTTTAGLAAFTTAALAQMPANGTMHSVSGHVRTRLEIVDNDQAVDTRWGDRVLNRALLNIDVSPTDTLKVRISPMFTHTFDTGSQSNKLATNESVNDEMFTAYEAWMAWMPTDMWGLYVGRQALSYGNGLVLGTNDWSQNPRSFDAIRLQVNMGMGTVDAFVARLNERHDLANHLANRQPDGTLYGLYANFKTEEMLAFLRDLDLYTFFWDNPEQGVDRIRLAIFGARAAGQMDMVFYNAEFTGQYGVVDAAADKQKGIQADVTVGANFMDRHSVGLNFAYANSQYYDLFSSVHNFFGHTDLITRNNIMSFGLMADLGLTDMLSVGVDGYYFMQAKTDLGSAGGLVTADKRAMGFEGDFVVSFQPEEQLVFDLGYAFFKPLSALKDTGREKVMSDIYLQGTLRF